jgi:hypothetical protein
MFKETLKTVLAIFAIVIMAALLLFLLWTVFHPIDRFVGTKIQAVENV